MLIELQNIAQEYDIEDLYQDNNARLIQILAYTGLKILPGRNGNDAVDKYGNEFEIKTTSRISFSTNHHVNARIIEKYRNVKWLFGVFDGIQMNELYHLEGSQLEPYFSKWEEKLKTVEDINNPKIPLSYIIENGKQIYQNGNDNFPIVNGWYTEC